MLNEQGEKLTTARFLTNLGALTTWARILPKGSALAIEASTVAKRLYWHIKERGLDVRMAHLLEVRRTTGRKKKTDAIDSFELADLLRIRHLPEAYVPHAGTERATAAPSVPNRLGEEDEPGEVQIHALVLHNRIRSNATDLFGVKGRAELAARLKLGKGAGGDPSVFLDWRKRLLAMGREDARRVGLPWATVKRWKKRLRDGLPLENGHGGRALARLKTVLLAGGT